MTANYERRIVVVSLWRNDARRRLLARALHLLKKEGPVRFLWVVGDSADETEDRLREIATERGGGRVCLIRHDTGIAGNDPPARMRRLSETVNAALERIRYTDSHVMIHESDIISPRNVALRLSEGLAYNEAVAGWPVMRAARSRGFIFYDTWAYRANGKHFSNDPPYHAVYHPRARFRVDSVGTCWLFPAWLARAGMRARELATIDLCRFAAQNDVSVWVDPRVIVYQPRALWEAQRFMKVGQP